MPQFTPSQKKVDYARCISAEYHKLVDGKTEDEKIASLQESQSVENLYDIVVIGTLLYVGDDAAGCQLSSLFTGSQIFHQLIDENEVNVHDILDCLTVAVKALDVVAEGAKERLLKIVIAVLQEFYFETRLVCASTLPLGGLYVAKHVDAVSFLPAYSSTRLPWSRWLNLAGKEQLCIINWEDGIKPPGPDFHIRKLSAGDLCCIAGSYVDTILNGGDNYEAFSIVRWTAEQCTPVRQLRDSRAWQKLVARVHKRATRGVRQDIEIEDENEEEEEEEEEEHDGNQSNDHDEVQSNAILKHHQPLKDHAPRSRPQPQPKQSKNDRQRSIQPSGTSNEEASQPRPPSRPTTHVNVSHQSIQHGGTPVPITTKRHHPEWLDDDSMQFNTAAHNRRIANQSQPNPRAETNPQRPRDPAAVIPQPSYQRYIQCLDPPRTITNLSSYLNAQNYPAAPRSWLSSTTNVRMEPTIEEDVEMGDQPMFTDHQYANYHLGDDGQGYGPDGDHFIDTYEQDLEGAEDGYDGQYEDFEQWY
ncbi:hypothetical protein BJV78DRAFT_1287695 [Lactifluus subvellereus]|nr:hypothetical protein BJV78DRAFT_1287695 [Lactifluus subvellereus]